MSINESPLSHLSDSEILALSKEEITNIKNLALMEAGIPLVARPVMEELEEVEAPDVKVYYTGYFMHDNPTFTTASAAEEYSQARAALLLNSCTFETINGIKVQRRRSATESEGIKSGEGYSAELYEKMGPIIIRNKEKSELYEAKLKEFSEAQEKSYEILKPIDDKIHSVIRENAELTDRLFVLEEKYVPLADNNWEKAFEFYTLAFELSDNIRESMLSHVLSMAKH